MPNITWIIGNGFDIQLGLKTSFKDFYKSYCKVKKTDVEEIKTFKSILSKDIDSWADFELMYGKYSDDCENTSAYSIIKADVEEKLRTYLEGIQNSIDWTKLSDTHRKKFSHSLIDWIPEIKFTNHEVIVGKLGNKNGIINILTLNYTNVFHRLLKESQSHISSLLSTTRGSATVGYYYGVKQIGNVRFLHGDLENQIILGVDNIDQITNAKFHTPDVISEIVKPNQLSDIQRRNRNRAIPAESAKKEIANSSIICTFGASIGETDKTWWKIIADWLLSGDKLLVIFCYEDSKPKSKVTREEQIIRKIKDEYINEIIINFKSYAEWDDDTFNKNKGKIIVEINENLFNLKLPKKSSTPTKKTS